MNYLKLLQETPPWDWPLDAAKTFKKALSDRKADAGDRLIAASLAGDLVVMDDGLAGLLLGIAASSEETDEMRSSAALSLGPALEHTFIEDFVDPDNSPINEDTYDQIRESLHTLYLDEGISKLVRRRVLEASVRAPADWHPDAIHAAYATGDREWMLTAVFAMNYIRGFDETILEALNSTDEDIHLQAVAAAGTWSLGGAWPHVAALVTSASTPKPLLLAAIEAVPGIRPSETSDIVGLLTESSDEDISEAALDAIQMAELDAGEEDEDEDGEGEGDEEWIH